LVKAISQEAKKDFNMNEIKCPHIVKGFVGETRKEWFYEIGKHHNKVLIVGAKKKVLRKINISTIVSLLQKVEEVEEQQQRNYVMTIITSMVDILENKEMNTVVESITPLIEEINELPSVNVCNDIFAFYLLY